MARRHQRNPEGVVTIAREVNWTEVVTTAAAIVAGGVVLELVSSHLIRPNAPPPASAHPVSATSAAHYGGAS